MAALRAARTSSEDRAYRRAEVQARTAIGHFRAIIDGIPAPQPTTDTPEPMPTSSVTREDADAALREARVVKQLCERDQCAERDFEALTRANEAIVSAESSFAAGNYAHSQGLAKDATEKLNAILAKPRKDKPAPPTVDPEVKNAARDAVANAEIQQKLCESRGCEKIDLEAWLLAQKDLSAAKSAVADGDFERASRLAASADNAYRAIKQSAPTFVIPADASGITRSGDQLFVAPALSFASGSSQLSAASRPSLQALAKVLIANQDQLRGVRIVGYTDNSGSAQLNERISAKRAEAVRNALVALGVPAAMLTSEGRGPADPIADNSTAAGREANRRVEVRFTLKGDQS